MKESEEGNPERDEVVVREKERSGRGPPVLSARNSLDPPVWTGVRSARAWKGAPVVKFPTHNLVTI